MTYTIFMHLKYHIPGFLIQLATCLTLVCLSLIGLLTVLADAIPTSLIAHIYETGNEFVGFDDILYVMDIRVGLTAKVTEQTERTGMQGLSWSPDGTRLAFGGGNGQPYIWELHDGTLHSIGSPNIGTWIVDWSPIGGTILEIIHQDNVQLGQYNDNLFLFNLNDSSATRLTFFKDAFIGDADWSPDGRFIVFSAAIQNDSEIYRVDPDGSHLQQLTDTPRDNLSPVISPDGKRIVYVSGWLDSDGGLYIMNSDGGEQRRLTSTQDNVYPYRPVWSPDGVHILFASTRSRTPSSMQVNIIDAEGREMQQLANDDRGSIPLCWLDKAYILYEITDVNGAELYTLDLDANITRHLVRTRQFYAVTTACQP
jgi:Tol biopolymer transport system component